MQKQSERETKRYKKVGLRMDLLSFFVLYLAKDLSYIFFLLFYLKKKGRRRLNNLNKSNLT